MQYDGKCIEENWKLWQNTGNYERIENYDKMPVITLRWRELFGNKYKIIDLMSWYSKNKHEIPGNSFEITVNYPKLHQCDRNQVVITMKYF